MLMEQAGLPEILLQTALMRPWTHLKHSLLELELWRVP